MLEQVEDGLLSADEIRSALKKLPGTAQLVEAEAEEEPQVDLAAPQPEPALEVVEPHL